MTLVCVECGLRSETAPAWRAYLAGDPREAADDEVAIYCPDCAKREFGDADVRPNRART